MPRVYNKRNKDAPEGSVYVGRPSKYGNPFLIGRDGSREEVVRRFREWATVSPRKEMYIAELRGKDLVCWCAPEACHADVLMEIAND